MFCCLDISPLFFLSFFFVCYKHDDTFTFVAKKKWHSFRILIFFGQKVDSKPFCLLEMKWIRFFVCVLFCGLGLSVEGLGVFFFVCVLFCGLGLYVEGLGFLLFLF